MGKTKSELIAEREKLINDIRAIAERNADGGLSPDDIASCNKMRARHKAAGDELNAIIEQERKDAAADPGPDPQGDIERFLEEQQKAARSGQEPGNDGARGSVQPAGSRADRAVKAALDFRTLSGDAGNERRVREALQGVELQADSVRHLERINALSAGDQDMLRYLQMPSKQRNIVMGTDAQGGFLVPPNTTLYSMLTEEMQAYMGVMPLMTTMTTDTLAEAPKPGTSENVRRATVIAEAANATERTMPVFRQDKFNPRTIGTDRYGVTWQMMRSSGVNIMAYLARILGEQLARGVNYYLINGNGAATTPEPNGLNTATTREIANGQIGYKIGDTQLHVGTYSATSTHHGLAKLQGLVQAGVNIAYRQGVNSAVVMSDQILTQLRTAVSTTGQRLYPELDMPTIDGSRVWGGMKLVVDPNMPDFATNGNSSKMIYVGDFSRFWLLDVSGFIFIDDPYTGSLNLTHRYRLAKACDSELIDTNAVGFVDVDAVT